MEIHVDLVPPAAADHDAPAASLDRTASSGVASVVIDVLRGGTVAVTLFERGAGAVTITSGVRAARTLAARSGAVLVGERDGVPPEGFNHGSSPSLLRRVDFASRDVVLLARETPVALARATGTVWLAALNNAVETAKSVLATRPAAVRLVCAGDRGEPDLADTVAAGLLVALLDRGARLDAGLDVRLHGAARYCLSVLRTTKDPLDGIWASAAGAELRALGLEEDLAVASETASSDVVLRALETETVMGHPAVRLGNA